MIPLAIAADRRQVEVLRPIVSGRDCMVVGSAPMRDRYAHPSMGELAIPVNGAISSVSADPDIWVVGSKHYDVTESTSRPLHRTMLDQARLRRVKYALFLRGPKHASEAATLERLDARHCEVEAWSVLDKPTKRWIERELCGREDDKKPCSSGILTVAMLLWCGAAHVRLVGFSLKPGYHYLPKQRPEGWWRDHVEADKRALRVLADRFGDQLSGELLRQAVAA